MALHLVAGPVVQSVDALLDHLVYAVPDLDVHVAEFERVTGLSPVPGGRHLGVGTRNYLLGLGPRRYLEIIGPDPEYPPEPGVTMPFGVQGLAHPRLAGWAIHPRDIIAAAAASSAAGADQGEVRPLQRTRPDGVTLSWRLAAATPLPLGGVAPFLIDWGESEHPASNGLPATALLVLRATHPDPAAARRALSAVGATMDVQQGAAALTAIIATPRGPCLLS